MTPPKRLPRFAPSRPASLPRLSRLSLPLNITLLLALLTVVLVSVGGAFAFFSLTLQSEFRKLPPDIQSYLRARDQALREGKTPPAPPRPERRTATSSPTVTQKTAQQTAQQAAQTRPPWPVRQVDWLRDVQRQLLQIGLISVAVSALLSLWLARRIAAPVILVSRAAGQLAAGQSGVQVPVFAAERELSGLALSFNRMARSLETLESERRQAVTDIAHELRTPLAVMQARLDALEDGIYPLNTEQIALLSGQTQLLTRLVGDLRTLTLLDAGQLALRRQPCDLGTLAHEVVAGLQAQALARRMRLELGRADTAPVLADPDRLRQILTNLAENALRHARQQVRVEVTVVGTQARLTVDDDGHGIPAERGEQVFTRFTRLDESRSRDAGGSGLGLSIVRALAEAHGGTAQAGESLLGGARLCVTLPLAGEGVGQGLVAAADA